MNNKLKTKDIITIVLLSLINIVIFGFGTFFYLNPVTILLMPVFYSLFQGIVFFMLGVKVQKKGAILIYCIIQGVIGFNIPYILMFILAGIIGEAILAKTGYANPKGLTLSYVIMQLLASIGSTIYPYAITLNATLNNMSENTGNLNVYIEQAGHMIQSWGCLVLIIGIILSALLGAFWGNKVMQRHILKAQRVELDD